jgi:hypothetical protein
MWNRPRAVVSWDSYLGPGKRDAGVLTELRHYAGTAVVRDAAVTKRMAADTLDDLRA